MGLGLAALIVTAFHNFPLLSQKNHAQDLASAQADQYQQMVEQYCVVCHNEQLANAGMIIPEVSLESIPHDAEIWERVIRKLQTRTMPPLEMPRPSEAQYQGFVGFLENIIDGAAAAQPNPGRVHAFHRLNRREYRNAIRDIFDLDYDASALLPPDDSGYGFDNIADVLSVSPMLTERYLGAARKISQLAVGDPTLTPNTEIFEVDKLLRQDVRVSEELPFSSRGGISVNHYFPVDGEYIARIFLLRTYNGIIRGLHESNDLEVRLDGELIETIKVGRQPGEENGNGPDVEGVEVSFTAKAGPANLGVNFVDDSALFEGMLRPYYAITSYEYAGDRVEKTGIARVELRGPYGELSRGDTPARRKIFVCQPASSETQDEEQCASQIIDNIGRLAYRQTLSDIELQTLMGSYRAGRAEGDFDKGIEMALRRILVSPNFLFRELQDPRSGQEGDVYQISDVELASRLSFFLWSSIPDTELLNLAESGQLRNTGVLEQQIERMLADSRADQLIANFTEQWLYLRNIYLVAPDPTEFPDFDSNLRLAMAQEASLFLKSQFRANHSVLDLLTAGYTFLNDRLAKHYGLSAKGGAGLARYDLKSVPERGGLLTHGSVLTLGGDEASMVTRGLFVMHDLLRSGVNDPPPCVDTTPVPSKPGLTQRAIAEKRIANKACGGCHGKFEPLAFGLEKFDGLGAFHKTDEHGNPLRDDGEVLFPGTAKPVPYKTSAQLMDLLARSDRVRQCLTWKVTQFAVGRPLGQPDALVLDKIYQEAQKGGGTYASLIRAIIQSDLVQKTQTEADNED